MVDAEQIREVMRAVAGTRYQSRGEIAVPSSVNRLVDELRRLTEATQEVGRGLNRACDLMAISRPLDPAAAAARLTWRSFVKERHS